MHRFDDYQEFTETTDITAPAVRGFYYALGLAGESGEVADKIKKIYRDNNGEMDSFV